MALSVILQGIPTSVGELFTQYGDLVLAFGVRVLTFIVAFLVLYRIGKSVFVRMVKRALDSREFSPAVVSLGSSIAGAVALFGAVAVAAAVAGVDAILTAFATITGALALGVAFAAGDIIENFVAGIFILKDKPFEVGDHIQWNGNEGIVRKIDLRVTKLDTFNNEQVTVPNGDLANSVVMNPVANDTRRVTFDFGIEYDADIELAREIIIDEANKIDGILADPEPTAPVTGLADSAVVLNGRVWINPRETGAGGVRTKWVEAVKNRFDAEGVGMPYPHTELTGSVSVDGIDGMSTGPVTND
ncbi:mechanosensitive ion channel family protein [Halohasta litorea]|uniref:Mechanosensitive ion channel family protein n=1 Tax=Halohasta litorea TaxID=869891 RepID=A0ABD6D862_9EURY|nr:mechanosensitive ion channel family protein [Halohasta litorea]MEA1931617.1 mechanosensitive ion channel family protein [Euryarchaeota archaeon]